MMFVCRGGCCTSPPPMDHSLITLSPGEPLLTPSVSKLGLSLPRTLLPPRVCTMFPCVVALLGPPCPACRPGPEQCPQCKRFIQPLPWIRICLLASGNMYTTSQVRMRSMTPCSEHGGPLPHPPQQYLGGTDSSSFSGQFRRCGKSGNSFDSAGKARLPWPVYFVAGSRSEGFRSSSVRSRKLSGIRNTRLSPPSLRRWTDPVLATECLSSSKL